MGHMGTIFLSIAFALSIVINFAFADEQVQTTSQVALSGDLENDPVAQDILKKIEESKKQIAKLQRDFEHIQAKKSLKKDVQTQLQSNKLI